MKPTNWDSQAMRQEQFKTLIHEYLKPAQAIQSPEFLKGRTQTLRQMEIALGSPGRHVFIHGLRGVGKTSLAQTGAFLFHPADSTPIIFGCSRDVNFYSCIQGICRQALKEKPHLAETTTKTTAALSVPFLKASGEGAQKETNVRAPTNVAEAADFIRYVSTLFPSTPAIIFDEFDKMKDRNDHELFGDLVKQIADQSISVKFIFCGVGDTVEELFEAHPSAFRYFHTVKLERLDFPSCLEIIEDAAKALGITIDVGMKARISKISDGFPHYVHLLCEKLFWVVFDNHQTKVTGEHFAKALEMAVLAIEPNLQAPYERATRKYTNAAEPILWAVADRTNLNPQFKEIYESYKRIIREIKWQELNENQFRSRLRQLTLDTSGSILYQRGKGYYEFAEKLMRGYARLRADQMGVPLEVENPAQTPRFSLRVEKP